MLGTEHDSEVAIAVCIPSIAHADPPAVHGPQAQGAAVRYAGRVVSGVAGTVALSRRCSSCKAAEGCRVALHHHHHRGWAAGMGTRGSWTARGRGEALLYESCVMCPQLTRICFLDDDTYLLPDDPVDCDYSACEGECGRVCEGDVASCFPVLTSTGVYVDVGWGCLVLLGCLVLP